MRRKPSNPKRLTAANDFEDIISEKVKTEPGNLNSGAGKQTANRVKLEAKKDCNIIHFNGSGRQTNASSTVNQKRPTVFTFEGIGPPNKPRKCSCHMPKKDQSCQTPSNPSEWLGGAVNSAIQANIPSPSWSHSSDSEGSLPRTPNKAKCQYHCKVCQKPFPTPSKLRRHFFIHSGEKPFSCTVCSKPFNDPANLKRHYWTHVKEKPFVCQDCKGEFLAKREAMMHICPSVKRRRKLDLEIEDKMTSSQKMNN